MGKSKPTKDIGFKEKMASTWGLLLSGFSIFTIGFTAGNYISGIFHNLKQNDERMKVNQELIDLKSEYENKIHDLRERIYELEKETLKDGRNTKK